MLTVLLLIGLSTSVGLGEQSGLAAQVIAQGPRWESLTSVDTSDKFTGAGWAIGQSVDVRQGRLLIGADYRHRDGGAWSKDAVWLRGGVTGTRQGHTLRAVIRATAWASDDTRSTAAQVEYQGIFGRWVLATTHGILWFWQPAAQAGYFMTAAVGVMVF